jgi:hypothetical protein
MHGLDSFMRKHPERLTCTMAWKSVREWLLISAMALAWRACQASSDSSLRRTLFSCTSSQLSDMTVHSEPPAQPYNEAFWHLRAGSEIKGSVLMGKLMPSALRYGCA